MDRLKTFNGMEIKLEASELHDQLAYQDLGKFTYFRPLFNLYLTKQIIPVGIPGNDMFGHNSMFLPDDGTSDKILPVGHANDDEEDEDEDVIILHIDIRQPIKLLRPMLEQRIGVNLSSYEFWLQDAQMVSSLR